MQEMIWHDATMTDATDARHPQEGRESLGTVSARQTITLTIILSVAGGIIAAMFIAMGVVKQTAGGVVLGYMVQAAAMCAILYIVCRDLLRAWYLIDRTEEKVGAVRHVVCLFVPLLNLIWMFVAIAEYPAAYREAARSFKDIPRPLVDGLFVSLPLTSILCVVFFFVHPILYMLSSVISLVLFILVWKQLAMATLHMHELCIGGSHTPPSALETATSEASISPAK